jgi:hypothetical protein
MADPICAMCSRPLGQHSHDTRDVCNVFVEESPDDIVGHKTVDTGEICPETGFPKLRHEPMTRAEAATLWEAVERQKQARNERMPDEQSAINALFDAWVRLKDFGWREPSYCPKDGRPFNVIELGSTGIFEGAYRGEWPNGSWDMWDDRDMYCSSIAPAMFKLFPKDQAEEDARWKAGAERVRAWMAKGCPVDDDGCALSSQKCEADRG